MQRFTIYLITQKKKLAEYDEHNTVVVPAGSKEVKCQFFRFVFS